MMILALLLNVFCAVASASDASEEKANFTVDTSDKKTMYKKLVTSDRKQMYEAYESLPEELIKTIATDGGNDKLILRDLIPWWITCGEGSRHFLGSRHFVVNENIADKETLLFVRVYKDYIINPKLSPKCVESITYEELKKTIIKMYNENPEDRQTIQKWRWWRWTRLTEDVVPNPGTLIEDLDLNLVRNVTESDKVVPALPEHLPRPINKLILEMAGISPKMESKHDYVLIDSDKYKSPSGMFGKGDYVQVYKGKVGMRVPDGSSVVMARNQQRDDCIISIRKCDLKPVERVWTFQNGSSSLSYYGEARKFTGEEQAERFLSSNSDWGYALKAPKPVEKESSEKEVNEKESNETDPKEDPPSLDSADLPSLDDDTENDMEGCQ